jgi:hypothetical protein
MSNICNWKNSFLEWIECGQTFVARDPIYNDQRWLIRPYNRSNLWKYELVKVRDKIIVNYANGDTIGFLRWKAVIEILLTCAECCFKHNESVDTSILNKMQTFLYKMSYDPSSINQQTEESAVSSVGTNNETELITQ